MKKTVKLKAATLLLAAVITAASGSVSAMAAQTASAPSGEEIHVEQSKDVYDNFEYIVDHDRGIASIVKYIGSDSDVRIPSTIEGVSVRHIGTNAFRFCNTLVNVYMPDTVETMDCFIFSNCDNLETVELSNSLREMGQYIFNSCPKLKKISLPESLTYLEHWTFQFCGSLEEVYIPSSITDIKDDELMFCSNVTIKGHKGSAAEQFANKKGIPFVDVSSSTTDNNDSKYFGDLDDDEQITANDALMTLRLSADMSELTPEQKKLADIDGDGSVTANDALAILRYSVGLGNVDSIGKPLTA